MSHLQIRNPSYNNLLVSSRYYDYISTVGTDSYYNRRIYYPRYRYINNRDLYYYYYYFNERDAIYNSYYDFNNFQEAWDPDVYYMDDFIEDYYYRSDEIDDYIDDLLDLYL